MGICSCGGASGALMRRCRARMPRCIMAEAEGALYVAFMGTKQRRDLVANAQVMQDPVWPEEAAAAAGGQDAQVGALPFGRRP